MGENNKIEILLEITMNENDRISKRNQRKLIFFNEDEIFRILGIPDLQDFKEKSHMPKISEFSLPMIFCN